MSDEEKVNDVQAKEEEELDPDLEEGEIDDEEEEPPQEDKTGEEGEAGEEDKEDDQEDDENKKPSKRSKSSSYGDVSRSSKHKKKKRLRRTSSSDIVDSDEEKKRKLKEKLAALEMQMADEDFDSQTGVYSDDNTDDDARIGEDEYYSTGSNDGMVARRKRRFRGDAASNDRDERKRRRDDRFHKRDHGRNRREKSSEICKLFMQGKCPKNPDSCMFSHDAEPPKIMELCKFYLFERCAKKEKCLYLHKGFPCKYYHTGARCLDTAETCKFSHEPLTDETRAILLKHLELAPKDILGDFPRMTRDQAVSVVRKTEAKHKGLPVPDDEELDSMVSESAPAGAASTEESDGADPNSSEQQKKRKSRWGDEYGDQGNDVTGFAENGSERTMPIMGFAPRMPRAMGMSAPPPTLRMHGPDPQGFQRRPPPPRMGDPSGYISRMRMPPKGPFPLLGTTVAPPWDPTQPPPVTSSLPPSMGFNNHRVPTNPDSNEALDPENTAEKKAKKEPEIFDIDKLAEIFPTLPREQLKVLEMLQRKQKPDDEDEKEDNDQQSNTTSLDFNQFIKDSAAEKEKPKDENDVPALPPELTSLLSALSKKDPSSQQSRDPRMVRDPRSSSNSGRDPRRKSASPPNFSSEADKDKRILEMDLGSVLGDLDLPTFKDSNTETESDSNPYGLPFKPFSGTSVAKEIDASIYSHSPMEYRLHGIQIVKPDYSAIAGRLQISKSQADLDPRIRRYSSTKPASINIQGADETGAYSPSQQTFDMRSRQGYHPSSDLEEKRSSTASASTSSSASSKFSRRDPRRR